MSVRIKVEYGQLHKMDLIYARALNQAKQHWDIGTATARVSKRLTDESAACLRAR